MPTIKPNKAKEIIDEIFKDPGEEALVVYFREYDNI